MIAPVLAGVTLLVLLAVVAYVTASMIEDDDDECERLYPGRFPRSFGSPRMTRSLWGRRE